MHKLLVNLIRRTKILLDVIIKYINENLQSILQIKSLVNVHPRLMKDYESIRLFDDKKLSVNKYDGISIDELMGQIIEIDKAEKFIKESLDKFINNYDVQSIISFGKSTVVNEKVESDRVSINKLWSLISQVYNEDIPTNKLIYNNMIDDIYNNYDEDDISSKSSKLIYDKITVKTIIDLYNKSYKDETDLPDLLKNYILVTSITDKYNDKPTIIDTLKAYKSDNNLDNIKVGSIEESLLSRKSVVPVSDFRDWIETYKEIIGMKLSQRLFIVIKRYGNSHLIFNYLPLFDKDYVKKHGSEVTESMGLNKKVLKKMTTIKDIDLGVDTKDTKIRSEIIYANINKGGYSKFEGKIISQLSPIIIETLNDKLYRLLKYTPTVKPPSTFKELPIRPQLYNELLEKLILNNIKYKEHRTILTKYNIYKINELDELEIRNKILSVLNTTFSEHIKGLSNDELKSFSLSNYILSKEHINILSKEMSRIINIYIYDKNISGFSTESKISFLCNHNIVMNDLIGKLKTAAYQFIKPKSYDNKQMLIEDHGLVTADFVDNLLKKPSILSQLHLKYKEFIFN